VPRGNPSLNDAKTAFTDLGVSERRRYAERGLPLAVTRILERNVMVEEPRAESNSLGLALGRLPSGLFILTVRVEDRSTGILVSWVQQAGFHPPMLTVALRQDSYVRQCVERAGSFVLNQIPAGRKSLIRHFARGFAPDTPAFTGVSLREDLRTSSPVLGESLAYLEARVAGGLDSSDHRLILAELVAGDLLLPSGDPMVHVRHNGFHY
jgi:flavin reductase (DIM6/NTAB) family NADH-FMN oxidoreductase RutF